MKHVFNCQVVDDLDEIDGDEQQALVLCEACGKYEWHWIDRDLIGQDVLLERD